MALTLAFRRTARFYGPPLRRWVARSVTPLAFWLIGLSTGLYAAPTDHNKVTAMSLAGLLALWLLRQWSHATSPADAPPAGE
jgi:hypothetical protein